MENSMNILQEIKNRTTTWTRNASLLGTYQKGNKTIVLKKYLCSHIHGNITHNSQGVETTQISTDGWMDQENTHTHTHTHTHEIQPYKRKSCDLKQLELGANYAKWNTPDKDKYCIVPLIQGIFKKVEFMNKESRKVFARSKGGMWLAGVMG